VTDLIIVFLRNNDPLDNTESLGLYDPWLAILQGIKEGRANEVSVKGGNRPNKGLEFFRRRFSFHPTWGAQLHDEGIFVASI